MANATKAKEKLTVTAISTKFGNGAIGVKTGEKDASGKDKLEFLSFNKGVNVAVTDLEKGGTYDFELSIAENGKRFVNSVISLDDVSNGDPKPAPSRKKGTNFNLGKNVVSHTGDAGTKVDWAAKDRAMAAGGILHDAAAASIPHATGISVNEHLKVIEELALGLVDVKHAVEDKLK